MSIDPLPTLWQLFKIVTTWKGRVVGGTASLITIVAVNHTCCSITFSGGTEMPLKGWSYGIGLGAGSSLGGGVFVLPGSLKGDCSFAVGSTADVGGVITIDWWRGNGLIGTFTGAAIGASISITGGSGTWK